MSGAECIRVEPEPWVFVDDLPFTSRRPAMWAWLPCTTGELPVFGVGVFTNYSG